MEMTQRAEAESLLRHDQRNPIVMPGQNKPRWEGDGEKAPFLRNEPVKLTPAWEGTNLPNDTLNLKGIAMDLVPPRDRYLLIYVTLLVHGIGTLTAWNMFITATDYFQKYKLEGSSYSRHYLTYVGWASQIPNLLFSWINVFVKIKGDLATRIIWSLIAEVALFVITIILAMVDTSDHKELFFWLTMLTVFLLNSFNAIFQNSVYGVAARLPPQYTGAVVLGSNVCGTLVVFLQMAAQLAENKRTSAIYYFIGGMFVLLICFDTYFALPLNRFYRYHDTLEQRTLRNNPALAATNQSPPESSVPYGTIMRQAAVQLYNIFITFFVSLATFPAVQSAVKASEDNFLGMSENTYQSVTCFLTFNLMAMIGCITANIVKYPRPRWLVVFTSLRILFIPFFLLCNYQPDGVARTLPVLIHSDYLYWFFAALMAWSSGHGSSLGMMYVGGTVAPEHGSTAGMIGGATLVTGLVAGITFSRWCPALVTLSLWDGM